MPRSKAALAMSSTSKSGDSDSLVSNATAAPVTKLRMPSRYRQFLIPLYYVKTWNKAQLDVSFTQTM